MTDQLWQLILGMIQTNSAQIVKELGMGQYGVAAHYDSKNVALIEVLEAVTYTGKFKKPAKVKSFADRLNAVINAHKAATAHKKA